MKTHHTIQVSDRVTFAYQQRTYAGHVYKKGRKYAYVISDDNLEFRVPYTLLSKVSGSAPKPVQPQTETLRSQFHINDRVSFSFKKQTLLGTITRLNPKRAHIVCDDEHEYQIPYALFTLESREPASHVNRSQAELATIVNKAQGLMQQYGLAGWSFQFDNGTRRAGCCQYTKCVISMSYAFAKHASDDDIQDTLLHEIAHAIVGKAHNHDKVWQSKSIEIGCSGKRCHDLQFTPPRYIMTCENRCWIATAERRRRGRICKKCHGEIVYLTYTEERWEQLNNKG